jgi:osmoprotectant transport system permease protein
MRDEPFVDWSWIADHLDEVRTTSYEHLRLTVIAVVVGFAIAMVLALVAVRWRWTFGPLTSITGIIYSIPSLALFVILTPITGLGTTLTAEIGLVGYTLLILLRNIVAGIDGVPAHVKDAADGMGYTPSRRFVEVDLRLAIPTIIAGIRIATVTTVGLVTVTALVGLGGLGSFITSGLQRDFSTEVVLGAGLSVLLAVTLDVALVLLQRVLTPWSRAERRRRDRPVLEPVKGAEVVAST